MTRQDEVREAALAYAANGWPVLRCWTNTEDGCACGRKGCASPGKHPYKTTHGVNDATTDLDEISRWKGSFNVGIALGHAQLLVFDLDDANIAKALIAAGGKRLGQTGVVRTRGTHQGMHIYFMCVGDPPATTDIFDKNTGDNIGQIRGLGGYVVAPPSVGVGGKRRYKWLGEKYDEWVPALATAEDPLLYVQQLLRPLKIEVEAARQVPSGDVPDVELEEVTILPKALRKDSRMIEVRQILEGKLAPTVGDMEDRSRRFQSVAALIAYTAAGHGYVLKAARLARILKALDARYFQKYVDRSEAQSDKEYMRTAGKVLALPSAKVGAPPPGSSEGDDLDDEESSQVSDSIYTWDEESGLLCIMREKVKGGHSFIPIANFLPQISATAIIDDPDEASKEIAWRLRVRRAEADDGLALSLRAEDYDRSRSLSAALNRRLPYGFTILHGGEEHMQAATKSLSPTDAPTYLVPAVPGWYIRDGRYAYVLPGSEVAIGPAGVEQSFLLHKEDLRDDDAMCFPALASYGVGVLPAKNDRERRESWRAFGRLFTATSRPHVAAAIIFQVLAGPLFDAGVSEVPPLVHVVGRTGVLKTSYCLAVLSLMGTFETSAPVNWRSTAMGLAQALNKARHMTLLVDDYKTAGMRRDMGNLIQQYADGSRMIRHSIAGLPAERPRGLILSNGEDKFKGSASVSARATSVEVREGDISSSILAECQEDAEKGILARLGAMYVQWLARSGVLEDGSLREARELEHRRLLSHDAVPGHRRVLRTAASLLAVGKIVLRFVLEQCDDTGIHDTVKDAARDLRRYFIETSEERAQEVEEQGPLDHLVGFLVEKMAAGEAVLRARPDGRDFPKPWPGATVVGWHMNDRALLSEHLTFAYYQEEMGRRREELSHGWSSITQNIREKYGARSQLQVWIPKRESAREGGTSRRSYSIPLEIFDQTIKKKGSKNDDL